MQWPRCRRGRDVLEAGAGVVGRCPASPAVPCQSLPGVPSLGSLPGAAPAMPQRGMSAFLASSLIPAVVCCSPAFGTFWRNLAGRISYRYRGGERAVGNVKEQQASGEGQWGRAGMGLAGARWGSTPARPQPGAGHVPPGDVHAAHQALLNFLTADLRPPCVLKGI